MSESTHYNYLIIGGGIAGATAAETIRERDNQGLIAILTEETHPLYSRVLLPNYANGRIPRQRVFLKSFEDFEVRRIDWHKECRVLSLDTSLKIIHTNAGDYSYDKLLIATGGHVRKWTVPGGDMKGVFQLQTLNDTDAIVAAMQSAKKAVIIGGGFIAVEFLEICRLHNLETTLFCRDEFFFEGKLDKIGARILDKNFQEHGVRCVYGAEVAEVRGKEYVQEVALKSGEVYMADFIGVGVGIERSTAFLSEQLEIVPAGIKTNEFLETSAPAVWAAGDIAYYYDMFYGKHQALGNWTNAVMQGRYAGENMTGTKKPLTTLFGYNIVNFGLQIAFIGDTIISEEIETITRSDSITKKYERFFIKNNRLQGAIMINMFSDRTVIASLIQKRVDIGEKKELLSDMGTNLSSF